MTLLLWMDIIEIRFFSIEHTYFEAEIQRKYKTHRSSFLFLPFSTETEVFFHKLLGNMSKIYVEIDGIHPVYLHIHF